MENTYTWEEISTFLNSLTNQQLIDAVTLLKEKFGLSRGQAKDYVLYYMGIK